MLNDKEESYKILNLFNKDEKNKFTRLVKHIFQLHTLSIIIVIITGLLIALFDYRPSPNESQKRYECDRMVIDTRTKGIQIMIMI